MPKPSALIWGGPVFPNTPQQVQWLTSVEVLTYSRGPDGGFGSSSFGLLADSCRGPDGRILDKLLAMKGKTVADYDKIAIAGYSAFHGLANSLLDADGDRISAAIAIDACFSAMNSLAKKGYAKFAKKAAAGNALFVLSASSGGGPGSGATIGPGIPDYSTGFDCVWASVADAGPLAKYTPPDTVPPPIKGSGARKGGLIVLDYRDQADPGNIPHFWQSKHLPVPLMQTFLAPYLAGDLPGVGGMGAAGGLLVFAVAAVAGWYGADLLGLD